MTIPEFFLKYEDEAEIMNDVIEASKDANTLLEFLMNHGVEVASVPASNRELSEDELSQVTGGGISTPACLVACQSIKEVSNTTLVAACKAACVFAP